MFSFELFLQSGKQNIKSLGATSIRVLGGQWGLVPGQVFDDDEDRVAECIVIVEFHQVFDATTNASDFSAQASHNPFKFTDFCS